MSSLRLPYLKSDKLAKRKSSIARLFSMMILLSGLGLLACKRTSLPEATPGNLEEDSVTDKQSALRPKTPDNQQRRFSPGPALDPSGDLLSWLESQTALTHAPRLRLPVTIVFQDAYRLAIDRVVIGVQNPPASEGIHLQLDDGAMGISAMDHLHARCPEGALHCSVWLEGNWGRLVDLPGLDLPSEAAGPKRWPFAVRRVGERIDSLPPEEMHVFVEQAP